MDKETYLKIINPAMELVVKKHQDYGNDLLGLKSYFPFGAKSYVQMIHVKTQRLVSLTKSERTPNYESMRDTVHDLINYSVFMLQALEEMDE